MDKSSFNGMDVEYGRRYAIMQKGAQPNYLLPVRFLGGNTEYDGFAPRERIRIKMNGGGLVRTVKRQPIRFTLRMKTASKSVMFRKSLQIRQATTVQSGHSAASSI